MTATGILRGAAKRSPSAQIAALEASSRQHIPYVRQIDAHTLETRSGDLLQVLKLDGKSFETEDTRELDRLKATRNTLLRVLAGGDYALWQHIVRRRVSPVLGGELPGGFATALNTQWRARLARRQLYINDLYLTLVRRAPAGAVSLAERAQRALSPKRDLDKMTRARTVALHELHRQAENVLAKLAPYGASRLGTVETDLGAQSEPLRFIVTLLVGLLIKHTTGDGGASEVIEALQDLRDGGA